MKSRSQRRVQEKSSSPGFSKAVPHSTDPFTLQFVAGHDNIKTTMRYVHPREDAVEKLFGSWEPAAAGNSCRIQKVGAKSGAVGWPSDADLAKY